MKITILGASGHGKVVADIAKLCGYDEIEFLDDDESIDRCGIYPVVGRCKEAIKLENDIFIAIGNGTVRKKLYEKLMNKNIPKLIHPNAVIAEGVKIGNGTVIMAGCVVNSGSIIGEGCILNTCSSIDHDCIVKDYVHVAVGAHLCGSVEVGDEVWIGAGSTVINNVSICENVIVGAGGVVIKSIVEPGVFIGTPVRKMEKKNESISNSTTSR